MKRAFLLPIIALLWTLPAFAQPSLCTITGNLYDSTGSVCSNCKITISKARQGSTPLNAPPIEKRADSNGAVSFTAVQGSFITITGTFSIGRYNFASGLEMYVPLQSSATLTTLQTAEDALNSLISTTSYAPADAGFITKTANGSLSNEFALGSLATGLLKNTTTTGVLSIAAAADMPTPTTLTELVSPDGAADFAQIWDTSASAWKKVLLDNLPGGGGGGGAVSSVFGRTGAVVAATNDYTWAQIDKTTSSLADIATRSASDLSSGTLPDGRFPATLPAASGVNLTALNASNLGSGTVPLARLSGITTAELSATAGITNGQLAGSIAYSKLSLTDSIVNADINSAAAIAYSKLNLTGAILNADLAGSIANAKLANSAITIAGTSTSLGGSISLDTITGLSSTGILKRTGANTLAIATSGTDYEVPLTFSTGLTRSTNTVTVNTSQNISTLSNLTSNGLVTTSGGTGALSITALGTGVATALGVNVGSAGAFVTFNGALGTPSSGTLTNATGLPLTTGVTGDLPFSSFVQAGSAGFVGATGAGDYSHRTPTQVTAALDAFVGDSGSGGTKGLVPAPSAGDAAANKYLKADGTWATVAGGGSPGGSNTQLQYNNSSAFGGISGATSDGTNVTFGSGNLIATSPALTTPAITTSATVTRTSLGTTTAAGIELTNTTAAAAGAQQVSPAMIWTGQGWKTNATAASQTVNFQAYVLPVQGAANPTANWVLQSQVNGGGYTTQMTVTSGGQILSSGNGSAAAPAFANGNNTGTGVYFNGGNTISFVTGGVERMNISNGALLTLNTAHPVIRDSTDVSASSFTVTARSKGSAALDGSPIYILGGTAGTNGNRNGGDVFLIGGAKGNSGTDGNVHLGYDGSTARGYVVLGGSQKLVWGSGSPESAITAPVGSIYLRTDGGAGTTFYVKESGSGNTGWVGK